MTDTITITNVGNVAESNVSLAATTSSGLTLTGLTPVNLAVGQSMTETVTLTPDASTPLNTLLQATITATYGPSASTQTLRPARGRRRPGRDGHRQCVGRRPAAWQYRPGQPLERPQHRADQPRPEPTSAVYKGQAMANLNSLISELTTDPFLAGFTPA